MSKYDDEGTTVTKGKLVSKKLRTFESKSGKEYKAYVLVIEKSNGDERKFKVGAKSKPAKFIDNLKEDSEITVKEAEGDYGKQVVAVFSDRKFAKTNKKGDSVGQIQGMVLKAALDLAIANRVPVDGVTADDIIKAAKTILTAKLKTDDLVSQALKPKDDEDDEDDATSNSNGSDDESTEDDSENEDADEEAPSRRRKSKESPY